MQITNCILRQFLEHALAAWRIKNSLLFHRLQITSILQRYKNLQVGLGYFVEHWNFIVSLRSRINFIVSDFFLSGALELSATYKLTRVTIECLAEHCTCIFIEDMRIPHSILGHFLDCRFTTW